MLYDGLIYNVFTIDLLIYLKFTSELISLLWSNLSKSDVDISQPAVRNLM